MGTPSQRAALVAPPSTMLLTSRPGNPSSSAYVVRMRLLRLLIRRCLRGRAPLSASWTDDVGPDDLAG